MPESPKSTKRKKFSVSLEVLAENTTGDGQDRICLSCGNIQDGCEPDAEGYQCDMCGKYEVTGISQAAIMGVIDIT